MLNLKFGVKESKVDSLYKKMKSLGIKEKDIEEKFVRSSGPGGQKTNKTSTCVYLKHLPTGIGVKCQKERNQALNRFLGRRILINKIETKLKGKESLDKKKIFKIRKQKQRRSRRAKEKVLKEKRINSEKKKLRNPPSIK